MCVKAEMHVKHEVTEIIEMCFMWSNPGNHLLGPARHQPTPDQQSQQVQTQQDRHFSIVHQEQERSGGHIDYCNFYGIKSMTIIISRIRQNQKKKQVK